MIVIIEGLDGVGKTTLSKRFAEKYGFKYIKESYTDDCKEKENRIKMLLERLISGENYIYDRTTLIDDFVYSFLNKTDSTLFDYLNAIIALLDKTSVIHVGVDELTRIERFNERGDAYIKSSDTETIKKGYEQFYKKLKKVTYFDLTNDLEKDVERLMEVIENDKDITHRI